MKKWSFLCRVSPEQSKSVSRLLADFSGVSLENGYLATIQADQGHPSSDGYVDATVTLYMDDEYIDKKRGARRGPKPKPTNITVEEMARLKDEGMPPKEIAELAGIGVATYFRKMAAYRDSMFSGGSR